jgi:hypothetical protein
MAGQGRPSSKAAACAQRTRGRVRALVIRSIVVALCGQVAVLCGAQHAELEPVRLRVGWGGGEKARWVGRASVDGGAISDLKLLGRAADAAGSIWLENGAVEVATLSNHNDDAFEITVAAGQGTKLLIELSADPATAPSQAAVALADLAKQPYVLRLDDRGNTLKIEPVPESGLQVVMDRDQRIFAPGEPLALELRAALAEAVSGTTLDIHASLSPARGTQSLWSSEQRMDVPVQGQPRMRLSVPLPQDEGAYTLRLTAMRPSGFRERFFPGNPTPLAERKLDLVVLDSQPRQASQPAEWETVLEIDPTSPRWWERLPNWTQLRRIPGLNRGPLGSMRAGAVELPAGRFVELPPRAPGADPYWQAYSLPLESAGTPHRLEVDFPAGDEQHFGISIIEPNAAGVIEGIGRDGGVYVEGFGRALSAERQTHRILFWPRTQAPLLLVTNAHPTAAARFGQIRVLKLRAGALAARPIEPPSPKRLVAAYLATPLIPETFGASKGLDQPTGSSAPKAVDDWQTFYESATRLADYLRYGGYNSAVISVAADGSSIYPSSKLAPTPLYNASLAQADDAQCDALELLLRVFDREGLALLPALQFATPLPELEALRRGSDPQTSGLEWVGPEGHTLLAGRGTSDGRAPYYNLLDPRVQRAMLDLARELVERYGNHPSFAGLAVQLSAHGYAQLPPLEWGLDDVTIGRFERDTGIQLAGAGPARFAARQALVTGEQSAAWSAWRAARVAEFYQQLAQILSQTGGHQRLLITMEQSFADPQQAAATRPELIGENRFEASLLELGIDRESLSSIPHVTLCLPRYVGPLVPLADHGADLEIKQAAATWHRQAGAAHAPAALLYHRPQQIHLATFEGKSPIPLSGKMVLNSQPLAHGAGLRQPYVESLLDADPELVLDGGELLPFGQEDSLRQVRAIIAELPTSAAVTDSAGQPVFVRSYAEADRTTLLVVNACPWHVEAEVVLELSQATELQPLTPMEPGAERAAQVRPLAAGSQPWSLSLAPYAVEAVRLEGAGVNVAAIRADVSEAGKAELSARLADLANRDFTASRIYPALANPSFEPLAGAAPVPGWSASGNATAAELDATTPQEGKTCVYFYSGGTAAALESDDFPTPPTGQLAMTVFARGHDIDPRTELRMVFEADHAGRTYRRSFIVGGPQTGAQRLEPQWRPYAILVNDLPLDSRSQMRVRFELVGQGEVWLDNVKLYDLLFPLKFHPQAQAEIKQFFILIHAAQRAFEMGRLADCVRLLEGYWPRFISAYVPLAQPSIAVEPPPQKERPSPPPADQEQQTAPSIGERIKRFVPFVR